jgi:hypothetical protein
MEGGGAGAQLVALTSQDGGDTFGAPVPVSAPGTSVAGHGESAPSLVLGAKGLGALWEQKAPTGTGTQLVASGSAMASQWSKPVVVTDKPEPSTNSYSSLSVAPNGDFYAVWLDGRSRVPSTLDVYLSRSTDGGKTWSANTLVARGACPCCRPVAAITAQNTVHVAWRHVYAGDIRDIALATSRDGGASFSPPTRVAVDGWHVVGCPHTGPALAVVGDILHVAWYSEGRGGDSMGLRWSLSSDGGKRFAPPVILSRGVLDPNHPCLVASENGRLFVTFQGRNPAENQGWGTYRAYWAEVTSTKTASLGVRLVPGTYHGVSYPVGLLDTAGRFWMLWTQSDDHGETAQLLRGRLG